MPFRLSKPKPVERCPWCFGILDPNVEVITESLGDGIGPVHQHCYVPSRILPTLERLLVEPMDPLLADLVFRNPKDGMDRWLPIPGGT
jgi:hypothetical protein